MTLVLYEDTVTQPAEMESTLARALGLHHDYTSTVESSQKEGHTAESLCDYDDVHCDAHGWLPGLHAFPCLLAQFTAAKDTLWTMPMLIDRTIHVQGDCEPLSALRSQQPRQLAELYARSAKSTGSMALRTVEWR